MHSSKCLLQDNILYCTVESDSHALYMEFSRLLFAGTADLHLGNFLHMVATMAKSGYSEEQTEFFILNSQNVPKLPEEEPIWSLASAPSMEENNEFPETISASTVVNQQSALGFKKKTVTHPQWPPLDWKTAPGLSKRRSNISQPIEGYENIDSHASSGFPIEMGANLSMGDNVETTSTVLVLLDSERMNKQHDNTYNPSDSNVRITFDSVDLSMVSDSPPLNSCEFSQRNQLKSGFVSSEFSQRNQLNGGFVSSEFSQRGQLLTGTPNAAEALLTGKLGELAAFKYFTGKLGKAVKWINKDHETGLPYDLLIGGGGQIEYIEVKTTKSAWKDWFNISTREWQFAAEKGDSFSIAHVVLSSDKEAQLSVYKNPVKLCQLGKLQLVVLMPRQQKDLAIIS